MVAITFSSTVLQENGFLALCSYFFCITGISKSYKNLSKEIKIYNFCYRKVGRAITKWGAIEKSPILLSQYWKIDHF